MRPTAPVAAATRRAACALALGVALGGCGPNERPRIHSATRLESGAASGPFEVWADVSDDDKVVRVALLFRTWQDGPGAAWTPFEDLTMEPIVGGHTYRAELPAQPPGTVVEYEVAAADGDGAITRFPGDDALVRFTAGQSPAEDGDR